MSSVKMKLLNENLRITSFDEVALGYSKEEAIMEAKRCLNCKHKPCVSACPVGIDIPGFIKKIKEDDINGAYDIIVKDNLYPAICGRVCPQETQCESKCILRIKSDSCAIGNLERFVGDNHTYKELKKPCLNGKKVAVIGSGPAGLSFSAILANNGYKVVIYEAMHKTGGVLIYGIPQFRLPKSIVADEIARLEDINCEIITNCVIGKSIMLEELLEEYDYVFIGTGAGLPKFMNIKGESYNGVYSANEFLTRINLMNARLDSKTPLREIKNVAVIGGGNVAMDAIRSAKRLGAENTYLIYRRTINEMPARKAEIEHALEEGIEFLCLNNPISIEKDTFNNVKSLNLIKMELGDPDESGRRSPVEIKNSEYDLKVDTVIMALGNYPNPILKNSTKLINFSKWGTIEVDENNKTSHERIYAGGDIVTGAATVILAMGAGKKAAEDIIKRDKL